MGIGSVAYVATELDRNAIGFELKESYYDQSLRNIEIAKDAKGRTMLFPEQSLADVDSMEVAA
jgi:hypothetical protein